MKKLIEAYQAAIIAIAKRKTLADTRHALAAVEREVLGVTCYGFNTNTKAEFVAYCEREIALLVERAHQEALDSNEKLDAEFASIEALAPNDDAKKVFKAIASRSEVGCVMGVSEAHAVALEINAQVNDVLASLCRVVAGIRRSGFKDETKQQLIGAACRGVLDGLHERLGVTLKLGDLPNLAARAGGERE